MRMLLVGALGMLALQVLLVVGYLAVSAQDPIILNPNSGSLQENGVTMVMLCGETNTISGRPIEDVLDKVPPDGDVGAWTQGRTLRGNCDVFYHHSLLYNPHAQKACLVGCENNFLARRLR